MTSLVFGLVLCVISPMVQRAAGFDWCYHNTTCNEDTWAEKVPKFCNGTRQSPINIVSSSAKFDANLTAFTFTNYGNTSLFSKMKNTGRTVKMTFNSGAKVSGGGLSGEYDSLQFHLHWGNGSSVPGSEHTVDGTRYPMEFHIVSTKAVYNGNTTAAVADSTGAAALGFLIKGTSNTTGQPAAWKTLVSYLSNITLKGDSVDMSGAKISLDDLVSGVNRSRYYRYLGSLTTPACYEAVVWTVFKEPLVISNDLIDMFAKTVRIDTSDTSEFMVNVHRKLQPTQPVTHSASSKMTVSYGLLALMVALWKR